MIILAVPVAGLAQEAVLEFLTGIWCCVGLKWCSDYRLDFRSPNSRAIAARSSAMPPPSWAEVTSTSG